MLYPALTPLVKIYPKYHNLK